MAGACEPYAGRADYAGSARSREPSAGSCSAVSGDDGGASVHSLRWHVVGTGAAVGPDGGGGGDDRGGGAGSFGIYQGNWGGRR